MNWAQIIAACIISGVTLLNIYFTVSGNRESQKNEVRQKYVERQSDALEAWWQLTLKSITFKELDQVEQDELIRRFIWLPSAVRAAAEGIMKNDNAQARSSLRTSIRKFIEDRTEQG